MPHVLMDHPDEHHSAFVDPWSHQAQHRGDIPDHALFAGAWHLDVGIDILHEALFLARDERGDRLWSLITPAKSLTLDSLSARERGDRGWVKMMITSAVWPGRLAMKLRAKRREPYLDRLPRARIHFSGPRPPYFSGLVTRRSSKHGWSYQ